jgi:hypothetical protein
MLVIRQLKPIGTFSEKQAKKYLKRGLLFLIPFALLWLTSIHPLPFYIDMGIFNGNRELLKGVLLTFGMLFIMLPYRTWKSGLNGERNAVKNISDKLNSDYSIFNDVLLKDGKRGNVDHIIVGPTGIFVVETKNNEGTITYDGCWKGINGNPSEQANSNMFRVKDILKECEVFKQRDPYVKSVVVFTNRKANVKILKEPKWGCRVVQIKTLVDSHLSDYIKNEPPRFSDKEIMSIEQSLRMKIGNYNE